MFSFPFISFLLLLGDWVFCHTLFHKKMFNDQKNRALEKYESTSDEDDQIWDRGAKPKKSGGGGIYFKTWNRQFDEGYKHVLRPYTKIHPYASVWYKIGVL